MAAGKTKYFANIYNELVNNENADFWELTPIRDTTVGRVVSYVIFRKVGVDIAKYFSLLKPEDLPAGGRPPFPLPRSLSPVPSPPFPLPRPLTTNPSG
ncbi:MAG: hypothetical protein LBI44_01660, partial [Oscillospiraceae bacterium]|nr:hypothetical protein [Oscillospiraceae bacterium]